MEWFSGLDQNWIATIALTISFVGVVAALIHSALSQLRPGAASRLQVLQRIVNSALAANVAVLTIALTLADLSPATVKAAVETIQQWTGLSVPPPAAAPAVKADRKIALVVGNANYRDPTIVELRGPIRDAETVAQAFTRAGFETTRIVDATNAQMLESLERFSRQAGTADIAAIYMSGHGVLSNGRSVFVPVDSRLLPSAGGRQEFSPSLSVPLTTMVSAVSRAGKVGIIFWDASGGTIPSITQRTPNRAKLAVSFASQPNQVVLDSAEASPFARALSQLLPDPKLSLNQLLVFLGNEVRATTSMKQSPVFIADLGVGDYYLAQPDGRLPAPAAPEAAPVPQDGGMPEYLRPYEDQIPRAYSLATLLAGAFGLILLAAFVRLVKQSPAPAGGLAVTVLMVCAAIVPFALVLLLYRPASQAVSQPLAHPGSGRSIAQWSRDGKTLYWASQDGYVASVPVTDRTIGKPLTIPATRPAVTGDAPPVRDPVQFVESEPSSEPGAPQNSVTMAIMRDSRAYNFDSKVAGNAQTLDSIESSALGEPVDLKQKLGQLLAATSPLGRRTNVIGHWRAALADLLVYVSEQGQTARILDRERALAFAQDERSENSLFAYSTSAGRIAIADRARAGLPDTASLNLADVSNPPQRVLTRGNRFEEASFNFDASLIVTANSDNTATIWDAKTGVKRLNLTGHKAKVADAQFSPDGAMIVTASWDRTAKLWDAKSGAELFTIVGHNGEVNAASVSPDGKLVVTSAYDNTAKIWSVADRKLVQTLAGHSRIVYRARFSYDGSLIATASLDRTTRIWSVATGELMLVLKGHNSGVIDASFSPDGRTIATGSFDRTVKLWNSSSGVEIATLQGHSDNIVGVQFSPDGQFLVTASVDRTARLWDVKSGKQISIPLGHSDFVVSAKFSSDGRMILTASDDGAVRLWDIARHGAARQLAWGTDRRGGVIAAAFDDGGVGLYRVPASAAGSAELPKPEWIHTFYPYADVKGAPRLSLSTDGRRLMVYRPGNGGERRRVTLIDLATLTETSFGHERDVDAGAFLSDGRPVTAMRDGTLCLWEAGAKPALQLSVHAHRGAPDALLPNPSRPWLVSTGLDGSVQWSDFGAARHLAAASPHAGATICPSRVPILSLPTDSSIRPIPRGGPGDQLTKTPAQTNPKDDPVRGNLYALIIGISDHRDPVIPRLRFAADDARAIAAVLAKQKGALYADVSVTMLTNKLASRAEILDRLNWLTDTPKVDDVSILFMAGHGLKRPIGASDVDSDEYFFAPHDLDWSGRRIASTGVSFDEIRRYTTRALGKKMLFLDTRHSNQMGEHDVEGLVNSFGRNTGTVIWAPTVANQYPIERLALGNSAFALAILDAFYGRAPAQYRRASGRFTQRQLSVWLDQRIPELTDGRQNLTVLDFSGAAFEIGAVVPIGQNSR